MNGNPSFHAVFSHAIPSVFALVLVFCAHAATAVDMASSRPSADPSSQRVITAAVTAPAADQPRAAGAVLGSWTTTFQPWSIGFHPVTRRLWIGNFTSPWLTREFNQQGTTTGPAFAPAFGGTGLADMTFDAGRGTYWQLAVGGGHCLHEWNPATATATGETVCGPWASSQRGVALNPVSDTFHVGGWNDRQIYEIDRDGELVNQCDIGLDISGLAHHGGTGRLYVMVNSATTAIHVVDPVACSVVDTITVAGDVFAPHSGAGLSLDCGGNLWAANQQNNTVYMIDSGAQEHLCDNKAPGDVLESWPTAFQPWSIGFRPANGRLWVGNFNSPSLIREFTQQGASTGPVFAPTFGGGALADMNHDPDRGTYWQVAVGGDNCLHEWNPSTLTATGAKICGSWTVSQRGVAVNPVNETFYVGGWNEGRIYEVDRNGEPIGQCDMGLSISGLAYNHETGALYVMTNASSNRIHVVDPASCSVIDTFAVGNAAFGGYSGAGLSFDCGGDLWAANQVSNRIYRIATGAWSDLCGDRIFQNGFQ